MWSFYDKDGKFLPPRKLLLHNGEEVDQAELCEKLADMCEKGGICSFVSAAGTGKTLIALCAAVSIAQDGIERGKKIALLEPYKLTESSMRDTLERVARLLLGGVHMRPVDIYGKDEFSCPFLQAKGNLAATAKSCARGECPLYIPPVKQKLEGDGFVQVAKWNSASLYGVTSVPQELASKGAVFYSGAYLCPYYAQYIGLDNDKGPAIIITNYQKFLIDYSLGWITLNDIAVLVIDEGDELFRFLARPRLIQVDMLNYLRRRLKDEMEGREDVSVIKRLYSLVSAVLDYIRENDRRTRLSNDIIFVLTSIVDTVMSHASALGKLAEEILEIIPLVPRTKPEDVEGWYEPNEGAIIVRSFRARILEEIASVIPVIIITATPDYIAEEWLGLREKLVAKELFGQLTPPGRLIIIPFPNAEMLKGWHIARNVSNRERYAVICDSIMKYINAVRQELGGLKVIGHSIGKVYIKVCQEVGGGPDLYVDWSSERNPISQLESAINDSSNAVVITTRGWRGINPSQKEIITFILKFPRPAPGGPESKLLQMLKDRGSKFYGFFHKFLESSSNGLILDPKKFADEMAYQYVYQAVTRGNRGDDYVNYIISPDLEVYGAIARLAKVGLLPRPLVWLPGLKEPMELTDEDIRNMEFLASSSIAQAKEVWKTLLSRWESRAASLKKVVEEVSAQETASTAPVQPQPLSVATPQPEPPPAPQPQPTNAQQQSTPQPVAPPTPQPPTPQQGKNEEWGPLKPKVLRHEVREPVDKEDWSVLQPVDARDCGSDCPPLDIYEAIPDLRIMQFQGVFTQQEAESISKKLAKALLEKGVSAAEKLLEEVYTSKENRNKQTT